MSDFKKDARPGVRAKAVDGIEEGGMRWMNWRAEYRVRVGFFRMYYFQDMRHTLVFLLSFDLCYSPLKLFLL